MEADRLRECTFQPKLSSSVPAEGTAAGGEKPLVIKGIARHMELKMLAKRNAEELAQREQKAFLIEPPARAQPFTVPEPFKLHERGADTRTDKVREEVERRRMEECTFQPATNEASVAALLKTHSRKTSEGGYAERHARKA